MRSSGRRRRHPLLVLVVVLVVLAGLFVVADRLVAGVVERQVAARLQTELASVMPPDVSVEGFPFLTQAVAGDLSAVHVVAEGINTAPGQPESAVQVAHTDLRLSDVRSPDWHQTVTAGSVEGTAKLDYAAISQLAGFEVTYGGEGRVRVQLQQTVLGVTVDATVTGMLSVDVAAQTLAITDPLVSVAGVGLPDAVTRAIVAVVAKPIPVVGMPLDLQISSLTPTDANVLVGITGTDVQLTG